MPRDYEDEAADDAKSCVDKLMDTIRQLREELEAESKRADEMSLKGGELLEDLLEARTEVARLKETAFAEIVREAATERMGV